MSKTIATQCDLQAKAPASTSGAWDDDRLPHQQWQGREVSFMQSNQHSKERQGVWNNEGLHGAALAIVDGDQENGRYALHAWHDACVFESAQLEIQLIFISAGKILTA